MTVRRARIYDAFALLTAIVVISLDQWTKALIAANLGPADFGPQVPLLGHYLTLYYIRNHGAAFSMFNSNGPVLIALILIAVIVIVYLYLRMLNTGTLLYKLIFGLIIGGATGNLLDRFIHGSVVDFIWFQIPQIGFSFAIFNLADASISVGVFLLFLILLLNGVRGKSEAGEGEQAVIEEKILQTPGPQEQDA
ncbi:MAG TPA: signal peptidase II [Ktedonobacteraceae bacterium]